MKKKTGLIAAFIFAAAFVISYFQIFYSADQFVTDNFYQRPGNKNNKIKIIAIDEKATDVYGDFKTWSRELSADLVTFLNSDPENAPALIAFDIMYIGEVEEEGDRLLAEACEKSVPVIMAANTVNQTVLEQDEKGRMVENKLHIAMVEKPYEELLAHVTIGFANSASDKDGYFRSSTPDVTFEGERIPSFSMAVYETYRDEVNPNYPKVDENNQFYFAYTGKPGTYETFSFADILQGKVDAAYFKDAIVMVGAYAPGMYDSFNTPIDRSKQMYGVEVHANIVQALLEEKLFQNVSPWIYGLLIGCLSVVLYLLVQRLSLLKSAACLLAVIFLEFFLGVFLFRQGLYIGLITLPIMLLCIYVYQIVEYYMLERRRRVEVINAFKKYVAPQVVEEISKKDGFKMVLGGEKRDIAVLFVDIRGFTPMSENLGPEQVVGILNEYLSLTTNAIFENGGTLDKFIGDATMAVFNAPFDLDDYVYKAVCTGMDIVAGAKELAERLEKKYGKTVSFGVGINCGPAVVGNIGCEFRMDYTAIGDTVNTASRLESNAKAEQVLISEAVYERLKDRIDAEEIGNIPLKGKSNEVIVYSVKDIYK